MPKIVVTSYDYGAFRPFLDLFNDSIDSMDESQIGHDDVLILDGGNDIDPKLYGEEPHPQTQKPYIRRDKDEIFISKWFMQRKQAIIGICRGAQLLNVLNGGKLIQHINGHSRGGGHEVTLIPPFEYRGKNSIRVSSVHHQALICPNSAEIIALSDDGIPEIVWFPETRCLCIQGHPEYMPHDHEFPAFCRELVKELIFK